MLQITHYVIILVLGCFCTFMDSSEYQTVKVSGIQMVRSCDLVDHSNTGHFGPLMGFFSVRFSDHHSNSGPFDNQTQICNSKFISSKYAGHRTRNRFTLAISDHSDRTEES